jgi:hypothetical protein
MADEQVAPVEAAPEAEVSETEVVEQESNEQAPEVKAEPPSSKRKFDLKVNGKSKSLELDLNDEKSVKQYLEKAMAADEKFQESSSIKKQMEWLVNELRNNPIGVLKHESLGLNPKQIAELILNEEIEKLNKSPEQLKIEEMENKLKAYEEEKKKLEEQSREQEIQKLQLEAAQNLDEQMTAALASTKLPKSPYTVKRIADAMIEAVNMGYTDVTPEQVIGFVEEQITSEIQKLFEESPDEVLEKLAGKGRLDNYRKQRLAKAKATPPVLNKIQDVAAKMTENKEQPKISMKKLFGPM